MVRKCRALAFDVPSCGLAHYLARLAMLCGVGAIFLAPAGFGNCASASEIYVNNTAGSDLLDGSLPENTDPGRGPYSSIARALKAATSGDHILVANTGQPYRESISLVGTRHSGTAYQPFSIESNGAVLDGSQIVLSESWQHVAGDLFRFQPWKKQYAQLFLNGVPAVRHPVNADDDLTKQLEPKQWALTDGWIYFRVEPQRLPQEYPLSYAVLPVGVTLYKVDNAVLRGLVVQGFQIDGINLNDAVGPTILSGIICRSNGRSGVAIAGASQADLQACSLSDNGLCQLLLAGYSRCNLNGCKIIDNAGPRWEIHDGAKLLIDGKPASLN